MPPRAQSWSELERQLAAESSVRTPATRRARSDRASGRSFARSTKDLELAQEARREGRRAKAQQELARADAVWRRRSNEEVFGSARQCWLTTEKPRESPRNVMSSPRKRHAPTSKRGSHLRRDKARNGARQDDGGGRAARRWREISSEPQMTRVLRQVDRRRWRTSCRRPDNAEKDAVVKALHAFARAGGEGGRQRGAIQG